MLKENNFIPCMITSEDKTVNNLRKIKYKQSNIKKFDEELRRTK